MKQIIVYIINFLLIIIVIGVSFTISTIALARKVDENVTLANKINGSVEKKETIIISGARGNIKQIFFSVGDEVKKGSKLAQLENPDLEERAQTLSEFEDNASAQTELSLAEKEIKNLEVFSSVNGYIDEIAKPEGSFVNPSDKLFSIFSNENSRIFFELSEEAYKKVVNLNSISAYNQRLDQYINLTISNLKPKTKIDSTSGIGKIGVYFNLKNKEDGAKLLHKENVILILENKDPQGIRPIDQIKNTWMNLIDSK